MNREGLNYHFGLVGRAGSLDRIDTPALVLDLDVFEANIAAMAAFARAHGIALRPHAKTHKSVSVARAQVSAGAIGQCCAKLSEAEALADGNVSGILLTSAISSPLKIERLVRLAARSPDMAVVVEDADNVRGLAAAFAAAGHRLNVLIDVDVGTHRFGVTSTADAISLARLIADLPSLQLRGVQGYAGHIQAIVDYAERRRASLAALAFLREIREVLLASNLPCPIVTGGGTGTHDIDGDANILTELQVGSYVFSDVVYDRIDMTGNGRRRFQNSLFVYTRVVSAQHPGFATTDAGFKSFATDGPSPVVFSGALDGARYECFGDEFGRLTVSDGAAKIPIGTLVKCIVPHCDPNVNLFDEYLCVREGRLEAIWPIEARGCSA